MLTKSLKRLRVAYKGLTLYHDGLPNSSNPIGFQQNFSRDSIEVALVAEDPGILRDQLIFGNLNQSKGQNPKNGGEKFKYHHQLPGVEVFRGLFSDYCATDRCPLFNRPRLL